MVTVGRMRVLAPMAAMPGPVQVSGLRMMMTESMIVRMRRREMVRIGRRGVMPTVAGTGERRVSVASGAPTRTKIAPRVLTTAGVTGTTTTSAARVIIKQRYVVRVLTERVVHWLLQERRVTTVMGCRPLKLITSGVSTV